MKFMALIYGAPDVGPQPDDEAAFGAYIGEYQQVTDLYEKEGITVATEALADVSEAKSVRVRNGELQVMDGPFAETKEQLGGFYLFDVPDMETAIKYAQMIPDARHGTVEVRPVFDYTTMMPG